MPWRDTDASPPQGHCAIICYNQAAKRDDQSEKNEDEQSRRLGKLALASQVMYVGRHLQFAHTSGGEFAKLRFDLSRHLLNQSWLAQKLRDGHSERAKQFIARQRPDQRILKGATHVGG